MALFRVNVVIPACPSLCQQIVALTPWCGMLGGDRTVTTMHFLRWHMVWLQPWWWWSPCPLFWWVPGLPFLPLPWDCFPDIEQMIFGLACGHASCDGLPLFLNICLSRDFNKILHIEQNEWIYTLKYVYIHSYVVVHLKSLKRQIFRNRGSI